jgi:uncharacterized RDD family membrane protein YckC
MPTPNEFWTVAQQVVSERGGLVVGFTRDSTQPELGSTLDSVMGFTPSASAMVDSLTDWSDWQQQVETFYRLRPSWGRGKAGDPDASYYRIKFNGSLAAERPSLSEAVTGFDASSASTLNIPSFSGYATPTAGFPGVSFWPRLIARIVDMLVHYGAGYLAAVLFVFILVIAAGGRPPVWVIRRISHVGFPGFIAGMVGFFSYNVICTTVYGCTAGKLLFRMQVIQDDGSPCRLKSAVIRELAYFIDAMLLGVVAYFAMQHDAEQKRVGDGWAHTIVCKRKFIPLDSRQGALRFVLGFMLGVLVDIVCVIIGVLLQMNF